MNSIEQNNEGSAFGIAYQDNGVFSVCFLDAEGKEIVDVNVSKLLHLDEESKPITGFYEPLITVCFLPEDKALIAVYHRLQKKQYHFIYMYKEKKMFETPTVTEIQGTSDTNFPIRSFYSHTRKNCYVFYRQGHGFTI